MTSEDKSTTGVLTLGEIIGMIDHSFNTTNASDVKTAIKLTFDFRTATDTDIKSWLVSNRAIAFQRPTRALSASEIRALDSKVIVAQNAGQKVKSDAEVERDAVNAMNSMTPDAQKAFIQKLLDGQSESESEE